MNIKYTTIVIAFIAFFILLPGVSSAQTLNIGVAKWPPYENITNKHSPGFSAEVVTHVLKQMNVSPVIEEYPWARALKYVYTGKIDALFSAFYTFGRSEKCYFPEEALTVAKYVVFIRKEDVGKLTFNSLDDLINRRVGIVRGAAYPDDFLNFINKNNIGEYTHSEELNLKKLAKGRIDYIVAEHASGLILAKKYNLLEKIVPILSKPVQEKNIYIIFSKKNVNAEFVSQFSETLKTFKQTKAFMEIYRKYFHMNHT